MRKVKFKFWDKSINKMAGPFGIGIIYESINEFFRNLGYSNYIVNWDDVEILEFTGRVDKDKNDIFEGHGIIVNTISSKVRTVEFLNGTFTCYWISRYGEKIINDLSEFKSEELEIYGDIYETPELLKS